MWLWPLTSKINRVHPLIMVNLSAKFDKETSNNLVSMVFTRSTDAGGQMEPQQRYYIPIATLCAEIINTIIQPTIIEVLIILYKPHLPPGVRLNPGRGRVPRGDRHLHSLVGVPGGQGGGQPGRGGHLHPWRVHLLNVCAAVFLKQQALGVRQIGGEFDLHGRRLLCFRATVHSSGTRLTF